MSSAIPETTGRLVDFISVLRANGINVSASETLDAARALARTGYAERDLMQLTLRCTLVKRVADYVVFDRCFDTYFKVTSAEDSNEILPEQQLAMAKAMPPGTFQTLEEIGQRGRMAEQLRQQTLSELKAGNPDKGAEAQGSRAQGSRAQGSRAQGKRGQGSSGKSGQNGGSGREAPELAAALRTATREQFLLRQQQPHRERRAAAQLDTPLSQLTDPALMREYLRQLLRQLPARQQRRPHHRVEGHLDLARTLRASAASDGVLFQPRWRHRQRTRPRLVIVCDVSNSVRPYAEFLLHMLYWLQRALPTMTSFVFAAELTPVTNLFRQQQAETAIRAAIQRFGRGSTDYARVLTQLRDQQSYHFGRHHTLLILGDARNNGGDSGVEALQSVRQRVRQILWLNPEAPSRWGSGDSLMPVYAPLCQHCYSCSTLNELLQFVRIIGKLAR